MTTPKRIIAIVGATGNQGSSAAHSFLKLPNWHVRCLTRNPSSPASLALSSLGAEVIHADLSDISSLSQAFTNTNAIFLNTNFWETYRTQPVGPSASEEAFKVKLLHGTDAAIAAAGASSLERLVYSALPPMKTHSNGKYGSGGHWDSKATIIEYIQQEQPELAKSFLSSTWAVTTPIQCLCLALILRVGNICSRCLWREKSTCRLSTPKESTWPFVRALIEDGEPGTKLLAYNTNSYLTMGEIVELWERANGKEADYVFVTAEVMHRQFGVSMEVLDAPGFISEYGYMGGVDHFIEPRQLKTKVQTKSLEEWLMERDWEEVLKSLNSAK